MNASYINSILAKVSRVQVSLAKTFGSKALLTYAKVTYLNCHSPIVGYLDSWVFFTLDSEHWTHMYTMDTNYILVMSILYSIIMRGLEPSSTPSILLDMLLKDQRRRKNGVNVKHDLERPIREALSQHRITIMKL